jgi:hypothetical protein
MSRTRPTWTRHTVRNFVRHYLEMVAAMIVGMVALGPPWTLVLDTAGAHALLDRPELGALVMATNMTLAMSAWMRYRGHRWAATAEMAAAMYLPFIVLFLPLWLGLLTPTGLIIIGHVLMLAGMAAVMLLRPAEYAGHSTHQRRPTARHDAPSPGA